MYIGAGNGGGFCSVFVLEDSYDKASLEPTLPREAPRSCRMPHSKCLAFMGIG
jgi:hypothetical protein